MKIRAITCLAFWMGGALAAQATPQASVSFIENDFDVALQKAREQDRPLMVYAWAPWCHTCLSVKNFVFTDPALARLAQRFIWLKVDTEEARNAGFLERHTIEGVPTFFIIDPHNGAVLVRWLGSATLEQITRLLDEGHALARRSRSSLYKDLSRADRAYGRGDNSAAADAYEKLLGRAPQDWPARPRVTESLLYALNAAGRAEDCARIARASFAPLGASPSAAIIAAVGLDCAVAVEASKAARAEWIRALERDARAAIALPKETLAADDRSGVYAALLGARQDARDGAGARAVAEEWAVFLEGAAARAETPEGRSVYDSHRLTAYLALNQPERALPMLLASERDLPQDGNASARLAMVYQALGRPDEALAAADRALEKIRGPRRLTVLRTRAEILAAGGRRADAIQTLAGAIAWAATLPRGQRPQRAIEGLRKRLAALQSGS